MHEKHISRIRELWNIPTIFFLFENEHLIVKWFNENIHMQLHLFEYCQLLPLFNILLQIKIISEKLNIVDHFAMVKKIKHIYALISMILLNFYSNSSNFEIESHIFCHHRNTFKKTERPSREKKRSIRNWMAVIVGQNVCLWFINVKIVQLKFGHNYKLIWLSIVDPFSPMAHSSGR